MEIFFLNPTEFLSAIRNDEHDSSRAKQFPDSLASDAASPHMGQLSLVVPKTFQRHLSDNTIGRVQHVSQAC